MNKNLQKGILLIGATLFVGSILGVGSYYVYSQKETYSFELGIQEKTIKDATLAIYEKKYGIATKILQQYPDNQEAQTLLQYVNDLVSYSQGDLSLDDYVKLVESNVQLVDTYRCVSGDNINSDIYTLRRTIMSDIKNFSNQEVKSYIEHYLNTKDYEVASILNYSIIDPKDEEYDIINKFLMGINQQTVSDKQRWLETIPYNYSGTGSEAISAYMIQFYKSKDPSIGMTKNEVLESSWGNPSKINTDIYEWGTKEQWCYSRGYIYFRDGVVSSIQKR